MTKRCLLLFFVLLLPLRLFALPVPPLTAHVNDYAHLLSEAARDRIEQSLSQFEKAESTQIVILTIPTLEGDNVADFSIKVAEAWKIGWKGVDNGVILLVSKEDRKIRIEVGRGLEGRLTDLVSGRIIRNEIAPRFKAGDFEGGMVAGADALMAAVKGEYKAGEHDARHSQRGTSPIFTMLLSLIVVMLFLGAMSKILSAVGGGIGLPAAAYLSFHGLSLLTLGLLGGLGLIAGFVAGSFLHMETGGGKGRPRINRGDRGGGGFWGPFFGGGPFSGGGGGDFGGGGGFSGGGGDFGGGGASGDW